MIFKEKFQVGDLVVFIDEFNVSTKNMLVTKTNKYWFKPNTITIRYLEDKALWTFEAKLFVYAGKLTSLERLIYL